MSSLTHGGFMEDMSSDLRSVVLLGPKPRPPIGGLYHPNARQRQAAEAGARRLRVQKLLKIHESRKAVLHMERGLQAAKASVLAMEEEAGEDGVQTLAMFKSPAVPEMLRRKRRLRDALADLEAAQSTSCGCQGQGQGPAAKRHHLEVQDADLKRHHIEEQGEEVAAKRHRVEAQENVTVRRRRQEDVDDAARQVRRRLDDGVGVMLRHKRLAALQDEDLNRERNEALHEDSRRGKRRVSAQGELSRHRAEVRQEDYVRCGRRQAGQDQAHWQRSERVQDDALYRERVEVDACQDDLERRQRRSEATREDALLRQSAVEELQLRYRMGVKERAETAQHYHHVVRELQEAQQVQQRAEAADLKIQVTASSASPPVPKKLLLVDEDISPMMTAWGFKPGYEPTTPTDCIPSPLYMRMPHGVPASPRSPNALCRSPARP